MQPRTGRRRSIEAGAFVALMLAAASPAVAEPLTVKQISQALVKATPGNPPDFSHAELIGLDLSGLDFKGAKLTGADLLGANLSDANLAGTDLSGAKLDRVTITRTNFAGADLSGASLFDIAAYSTTEFPRPAESPIFAGADLSGTNIQARLTGVNMRGADLSDARLGLRREQLKSPIWHDLSGCDLTGAKLRNTDLHGVHLQFTKLVGADLTGANLHVADLSHADLTGADLTGADLSGADLDGTIMRDVKGLSATKGLNDAKNRDKAVY